MLLTEQIDIKIRKDNIEYFHSKGYIGDLAEIITIKTKDLQSGSEKKVKYKCDYPECGQVFEISYCDFIKKRKHEYSKNKDYCCNHSKAAKKEWMLANNPEAYKQENKIRYNKIKQSIQEKYGVDNIMKTSVGIENLKKSVKQKYGVENVMQLNFFKEKMMQSLVQNQPEIEEYNENSNNMYYKIHGIPCSKNQKHLGDLFQGTLNYLESGYYLDILLDNKTYFEYNGQGHKLSVVMNHISEDDFHLKEIQRYYVLKQKGYKQIVFESQRHKILPPDEIMLSILDTSLNYFQNNINAHWIVFDYDNNVVRIKDKTIQYSFDTIISIKNIL